MQRDVSRSKEATFLAQLKTFQSNLNTANQKAASSAEKVVAMSKKTDHLCTNCSNGLASLYNPYSEGKRLITSDAPISMQPVFIHY